MTRILFAGLSHATHSFLDRVTPLSDFTMLRDGQRMSCRGDGSMLDGFLEVAEREGWEVVPAVFYRATPSGTVADAVVEAFLADLLPRAAAAARAGVDAVYLVLHGAMSAESHPDVEGEVLARLRAVPGLERLPLFGETNGGIEAHELPTTL